MSELDNLVFQAAKRGDREAVASLIRVYHRPLRAYIATAILASQDVDDVAQEAFLRALERLDRVPCVDALGSFLRGIARNVVRERQRKYAREDQAYLRLVETRSATESASEKALWLTDPDILTALRSCLASLPSRSRTMLELRYSEELTSDQIGQQLGVKGPAVRTAMRRAREALLQCIQSQYGQVLEPFPSV